MSLPDAPSGGLIIGCESLVPELPTTFATSGDADAFAVNGEAFVTTLRGVMAPAPGAKSRRVQRLRPIGSSSKFGLPLDVGRRRAVPTFTSGEGHRPYLPSDPHERTSAFDK
jgi:hypothetical protein